MIDLFRSTSDAFTFDSSYIKRLKNNHNSFHFIFFDNINYIRHLFNIGKLRPVAYDNVQKTILCRSVYLGFDIFECPSCGKEAFIPHTCKSRFCTSCATKAAKLRSSSVSSMVLPDTKHRHIVFTIAAELRPFLH